MPQRLVFCMLAIAVAAFAGTAAPAAAATTQGCWLGKPPAIPEPQPIHVPQATIDRDTALLNAVAQNTFDIAQLAPQLNEGNLPAFFTRGAGVVSAYGPVQSMFPFEQQSMADETATYYRVQFPKETLTWVVAIDAQGKITQLSLRRTARCKIFNIVYSDVQY